MSPVLPFSAIVQDDMKLALMLAAVALPLGATEDRLVGALDVGRAPTRGEKAFEPGLLVRANRSPLYTDEVNLLEDHLVDLLIDVATSGENVAKREGWSARMRRWRPSLSAPRATVVPRDVPAPEPVEQQPPEDRTTEGDIDLASGGPMPDVLLTDGHGDVRLDGECIRAAAERDAGVAA